ncbi:type II toxin-antitoxin system VapB family antitoxin [Roseateles sp. LYH14W]|uniref:Type II toxin-antitoxin system VapB family antitoxin n=1 Tax=Pelomonas parva TaxID=3299032 RepID=A0ABW7F664_9BURK
MRTTVTLDDELYQRAVEMSDNKLEGARLIEEAVRMYVQTRAAQRLIALGGSVPDMPPIPRRRPVVEPT